MKVVISVEIVDNFWGFELNIVVHDYHPLREQLNLEYGCVIPLADSDRVSLKRNGKELFEITLLLQPLSSTPKILNAEFHFLG